MLKFTYISRQVDRDTIGIQHIHIKLIEAGGGRRREGRIGEDRVVRRWGGDMWKGAGPVARAC